MKKSYTIVALIALLVGSTPAHAQFGIAARAGTLGLGVEGAIGLTERVVVRGGLGLSGLGATTTFDGIEVALTLPDNWYNVGIDLYLNGALRVGGGVLFKSDDPTITGRIENGVDVGGRTFTQAELGTLTGRVLSDDRAAYALIGFGKHTSSGIGLSLDVGAAFLGSPTVSLESEGGTFADQAELNSRLAQEALAFEADMKTYLKVWPILNLAIRVGAG
jgi:hypothetical protein